MKNNMDLQDKTRMIDTYAKINNILDEIGELDVFPPLTWVWTWDVARSIYKDVQEGGDPEYSTAKDEEEMWELFWTQADQNQFTIEYGSEQLYEDLRAWMLEVGIVEVYDGEE